MPEPSSPRLRWLLLATHVPPSCTGGGMVRYAVELANALRTRDDIELHVLAQPDAAEAIAERFALGGERVHRLVGGVVTASVRQRYGVGVVDMDAFDVVHGTKHLLPRRSRATRVLTVHDLIALDNREDFGRLKRVLLPRQYEQSIADANALICVSNATRDRLVARDAAYGPRAAVVPLALSSGLAHAAATPCPSLRDRRFALVVGDASPRKNLRLLTEIWPAVQRAVPDLLLAVAGPAGWGVNDGLDALDGLVGAHAAQRLGHLDDAQLRWAYEHAAVVLCPSRLEGFGLPALEAVTFGAPVVRSPDAALAEASMGQGVAVALDDPLGWVDAIAAATREPRPMRLAVERSWDDVAAETVDAVRQIRER